MFKSLVQKLKFLIKLVLFTGRSRYCPVCRKSSRIFRSAGAIPRKDALCAFCGSLERHRMLWFYLDKHGYLSKGGEYKILHMAAEFCIRKRMKEIYGENYIPADLNPKPGMVKMDITHSDFKDDTFNLILCSHVLEHIEDDQKAMRELHRLMIKEGRVFILVPVSGDKTYENSEIQTPELRKEHFGQEDHLRIYGADIKDRMSEAGFQVTVIKKEEWVSPQEMVRMGLTQSCGDLFLCRK